MELLAPAGSEQAARTALLSGADAIYLGMERFSARDSAENFGLNSLADAVRLAHLVGAKVYVALNTLIKDSELEDFFEAVRLAYNSGADAILMQDLFLGGEVKRRYPAVTLHLSTQAGCCNEYGALLARDYGFARAVLARETPLEDIEKISRVIETEVFVQGALCTSFSGQCYLSSFAGNNSGNRGKCKQPCRKKYTIDGVGTSDAAFALSTSDLHLGGRLKELAEAGVSSLKIEGRMRRAEYVGAAVKYYRALLDGAPASRAFEALRRAYNRGDYTEGLAFGGKNFLSRDVQGHIGERIGTVALVHGSPFCRTSYIAGRGDGFKILRGGKEVGGAIAGEARPEGFFLNAALTLRTGDEVRLTTSVSSNEYALRPEKTRKILLSLRFVANEAPLIECGGFRYRGEDVLAEAKSAPLTEEELKACFSKTDGLPLSPQIAAETKGAFMPKSALNALRRSFYSALVAHLCPARTPLAPVSSDMELVVEKGTHVAAIGGGEGDILIVSPSDYAHVDLPPKGRECYLRLPPFFTSRDEALIAKILPRFDGVYCEGYYGIALAEKYGVSLFAGTGFNLTNRYAVSKVMERAKYFALSPELSVREQNALAARGAFALAGGDIRVMELCYCPFGQKCARCEKKPLYRLRDEEGREFPLRRYRFSGMVCRFEVFNCASLAPCEGIASALYDRTLPARAPATTKGHAERSML